MEYLSSHGKSYYKAIIIKKDTEFGLHLCKIQSGKTKLHTDTDALKYKGIITPKFKECLLLGGTHRELQKNWCFIHLENTYVSILFLSYYDPLNYTCVLQYSYVFIRHFKMKVKGQIIILFSKEYDCILRRFQRIIKKGEFNEVR